MIELQDSIKKYGVLNPLIVRPGKEGYYEIISGHRRKYAAERLGYKKIPVIIRMMQDEVKEALGSEYTDYNLIMATTFGMPINSSYIRDQLQKVIDREGLPDVVFHSLRHTSVTYKLNEQKEEENKITIPEGVGPELLMKVLGNPEMAALLTSLAKTMKV